MFLVLVILFVFVFLFLFLFFFFFSSRRRHTRWTGDWSSDVCSSDLLSPRSPAPSLPRADRTIDPAFARCWGGSRSRSSRSITSRRSQSTSRRSEERRVGKECRSRWSPDHEKKKTREERKKSTETTKT